MSPDELAFKYVVGFYTETQLNWWITKLGYNKEEILQCVERHRQGLDQANRSLRFSSHVVIFFAALILAMAIIRFLR